MNFTFTEEQDEFRRTVRRFLEDKSPSTEVRRLMETPDGFDEALWKQMAQELGLQGIHIPEEHGGQGFTFVELGIVLNEMGRTLLCAPYFASVCLAANAIMNAGTAEQQAALLPGIASGERRATLAVTEPNGRWDLGGIEAVARPDGDGWRLDGTKSYVVDGHTAHTIVVAARLAGTAGDEGVGLFVVDGDADGLTRTPLKVMDMTRKQARLDLDGVRANALGDPGNDGAALARTLEQARICLSAEATGVAERCLDMAVQYAKDRIQFGKPIGAFQAVKHRCADMLLQVESARTAVYYAMWAAASSEDELGVVAPMAKATCTEAAFDCASGTIQVHGGIGFTWEHDAHLYFRRAKSSEILFGDGSYHRELLAQRLGI